MNVTVDYLIDAAVVDWARGLCQDSTIRVRWRTRFQAPTLDVIRDCLGSADLTLVFRRAGLPSPILLFQIHDLDARFGHAQISVLGDPAVWGLPVLGRSLLLGCAIAFRLFPVRKLYAETLDWPDSFRSDRLLERTLCLEGVLRDHFLVAGEWRDVRLYSLWRRDFEDRVPDQICVNAGEWIAAHTTYEEAPYAG